VSIVLSVVFAAVVSLAVAFAVWPVWRRAGRGRTILAAALAVFVTGIGLGSYLMVGQPFQAMRAARGADTHDINGLIGLLVDRVHKAPQDVRAWVFLGRAYLTVDDYSDAARALARAIALEERAKHPAAELYSAYGEALVGASASTVPPEAGKAFEKALALDPKNPAARYYLGLSALSHGDKGAAIAIWRDLLRDSPPDATYRQVLVDRLAMLNASPGNPPDVAQMVAGLAARLRAAPDDAQGWQRLIRAYVVLGDKSKALAALFDARKAMAKNPHALSALALEAKELKLEN
jgi:cytochrome c-type biogenesis protein CcmH